MRLRRLVMTLFMLAWIAHVWRVLSKGVTPFDWLMWATELVVVGLIAYEIWVKEWLAGRSRKKVLERTFNLSIIRSAREDQHVRVYVVVVVTQPTDITTFKIRCTEDISEWKPYPQGPLVINVGSGQENVIPRHSQADGGCACELRASNGGQLIKKMHIEEELSLDVLILREEAWSGYLSFESYDADGTRRFSRAPLVIDVRPPALVTPVL